jgi:hypothetical protein
LHRRKRPFRIRIGPVALLPGERVRLPFQRSWKALLMVAILATAMTVPAVNVFHQAFDGWREFDGLFDLVAALFSSFWLMGWSVGLLLIWGILLALLMGREVLLVRPGEVELVLGVPGVGVSAATCGHISRNEGESCVVY